MSWTKLKKESDVDCNGWSHLAEQLPYIDYADVHILPAAHQLLYGVVKKFLSLLLPKTLPPAAERPGHVLTHEARRLLIERGKHILVPADFGRPYKYACHPAIADSAIADKTCPSSSTDV